MELVLGALVALVVTPIAAVIATRTGIVDVPGPLKSHARPVPYLGGLAVLAALVIGVGAIDRWELFVPLGLAFVLGAVDDVHPLPPRVRLGAEVFVGVAAGLVVSGDPLARVAAGVLVVVLLNAVNLIDGQDGLAASVGLIAALGFASLGGDAQPYGLALAGGLAGFLVFNRPPARIYLGDGGAYLVGAALALAPTLVDGGPNQWSVWFAVPLIVALPILDTAIAVVRRFRAGRPLFAGDRSHVYDQLVDRGLSVGASTALCALVQAVLTTVGALGAGLGAGAALACTVGAGLVLAVGAFWGGFVVEAPA